MIPPARQKQSVASIQDRMARLLPLLSSTTEPLLEMGVISLTIFISLS